MLWHCIRVPRWRLLGRGNKALYTLGRADVYHQSHVYKSCCFTGLAAEIGDNRTNVTFETRIFQITTDTRYIQGDWILFTHEGGVDVGDVDEKAEKLLIPVDLSKLVDRFSRLAWLY